MDIKPTNVQTSSYGKAIKNLVLRPIQSELIKSLRAANDTPNAWMDAINRTFGDDDYLDDVEEKSPILSSTYINKLKDYHAKKFNRYMVNKFKIDVKDILTDLPANRTIDDIVKENVDLIKSIPAELHDQITQGFNQIISEKGFDQSEMLKFLTGRFGVSNSRASLIATDQSLKTMGSLDLTRQQQVGFTQYLWRNVGDGAVRQEHRNHPVGVADVVYSYAEGAPIPEKHPKVAVRCRCYAEPVTATNSLLFAA